jgi:hypothetical protein
MPWGKYRGRSIADVPTAYLAWCLDASNITEPYRSAIRLELAARLRCVPPRPAGPSVPADLCRAVRVLIEAGYRTLALKTHPDRGGDVKLMQQVNGAREWARAALG